MKHLILAVLSVITLSVNAQFYANVGAGAELKSKRFAGELQIGYSIAQSFPVSVGFLATPSNKPEAANVFNAKFGKWFDLNDVWYIGGYAGVGYLVHSESKSQMNKSAPLFSVEVVKRTYNREGQLYLSMTNVGQRNYITFGIRGLFLDY